MNLSEKRLQELENKKISIEDLDDEYFIASYRVEVENIKNVLKLLNNKLCSFKEIVDKFKNIKDADDDPCLYRLLDEEVFEELIQNNKLTKDATRYMLNKIDKSYELSKLCQNTSLIKYILDDFILDKETVDKFNALIENNIWYKEHNIHTLFEYIEYRNKNNEEVLKLNELNKRVCLLINFDLTENQKLELIEVLKNNEIAQNTLIQLIDNNLEDQYDFESLKRILIKDTEKNLKTRFNF